MPTENTADDKKRVEELQQRFLRLKDQRTVHETYCQNVTQLFDPDRGRYPGDDMRPDQLHGQRMDKIVDSATVEALEIAQNGLHSGLTPSSRPWFYLKFEDDALNKYGPSRNWLDKLSDKVYRLLRQGGFYPAQHSVYGELLIFANGNVASWKLPGKSRIYRDLTYGEYWWQRGPDGKVDTVFRSWWMTAQQIVKMFGKDSVSRQVSRDAEKSPYNAYEIINCVKPRDEYDPRKLDPKNMPFESTYWENMTANDLSMQQSMQSTDTPHLLREWGFKSLPYYTSAWKLIASNMYGNSCPGMKQLGEAKYLMDVKEQLIIAVHKELDPPLLADNMYRGISIRSGAGSVTYGDMSGNGSNQMKLKAMYETKFNLEGGKMLLDDSRQAIKSGFFNQLFLMLMNIENQPERLTAAQVEQMKAQGLMQLGPFIEHETEDKLKSVVDDCISDILEMPEFYGLEKPPQDIHGQSVNIIFTSMLAQAQRELGKMSINEALTTTSSAAATWPEALDLLDIDEAMRELYELTGLPAKIVRSEDIVQAIRKKRAEEMQKKEMAEQMQQGADAAHTLGKTPLDPKAPNALLSLLGMQQEGGTQ